MYNVKIKKGKRILILFLIIITISFLNFSLFTWNSNNLFIDTDSSTESQFLSELKTADYSSNFSSTGKNINTTLHQSYLNNTFDKALSPSDSNNNSFNIPCPTDTSFNSSYTNLEISNINAPNKTLIVEDDYIGVAEFVVNNHYLSFNASGVGYIENISLRIYCFDNLDPSNITLDLFSAGTNRKPLTNLGTMVSEDVVNDTETDFYWHNITNIDFKYNASDTNHDLFYIKVDSVGGSGLIIDYASDTGVNDQIDESLVYQSDRNTLEYSGILPQNTVDFPLIIDFYPINNTPKPSEIGLKINNTNVFDNLGNSGYWQKSNQEYSDLDGKIDFKISAEWWDVTCKISQVQINFTKTNLIATTTFKIPGSGQSTNWTSTVGAINDFNTTFNDYRINFTVPATWENFTASDGSIDKTSDISEGVISNGYKELQIYNAGNGTNWYITAQSDNLLKKIHTYVSAETEIVNFNDDVTFLANFSKIITDGGINLSIYSPDPGYYLNHTYYNSSLISSSEIPLGLWDISQNATEYGPFLVQVWWKNDTAAGFLEKYLTIMAVTDLVLISPSIGQNRFLDDIFNITVFYNDTDHYLGSRGISGANIAVNDTYIAWVDEGSGYYNIEINSSDYNFGWNYIRIDANKTYYNIDSITFSFHLRINTTISPSNTKDFGDIIRGTIVQYEFNYSDYLGTPITGATPDIVDIDPLFLPGSSITENVGEPGNYTIELDTTNVQASGIPYECIFNITKTGSETKNITVFLTVIISQTDIDIKDSEDFIIKKDGLNQTILFYFNDTDNNLPITGLPVDDVTVTDNQTGLPRNIWLFPNGTAGYYILNVSVTDLNSGGIELMINITLDPNYATSLESVIFYLRGNLTQTQMISVSDPGGEGTLTGIGNEYTCFIGRDLDINFNITDMDNSDSLVTGAANSYLVEYVEIGNPANQGTIGESFANTTNSYQGNIGSSNLTPVGTYTINISVFKTDFEVSTISFNLTLRALYIINISIVDKPIQITAGESFNITIKAEYYNGSNWLIIVDSDVRITSYFDGEPVGTTSSWKPTNATGEVEFHILTDNTVRNMTLTIEVQGAYYHVGDSLDVSDIIVKAPPTPFKFEDLIPYLILIGIAAAAIGGSVAIYRGVIVPKKREKARVLTEVKTIFDDAINLEHILVLYKGTGTCIFFKSFGSEQIDPELISGFISAISSFGKDLVSQEELNEISYGDKMLLLSDGEHIRVALVLGKKASLILRRNLMEFIHAFEGTYTNELPDWRGQLNLFRGAGTIVDEILSTSIILPHEITYEFSTVKALKKPQSRDVLKIANNLMKDSERNFFFIATLLKETTEKTSKDTAEIFMGIKELRDRKILMPIEIAAIEAKPISQQELNLINQKVSGLVSLSPEEKQKLVNDLAQMGPAEREAYFVSLTEHHEIISAPVEAKPGAAIIDTIKGAKKEIKNLKKNALVAKKQKDYDNSIKIFQNAVKIATNWELIKESQELDDIIRVTKIEDLRSKLKILEKEAKLAAKEEKYNEATQKYKISSKIASEIFKLGVTEMTKEVKRLSNKSKEYEKLV